MNFKFYRCPVCGQIVAVVKETAAIPVCCGQNMQELKANTTDGALEKHVPVYEKKGDKVVVKIGSTEHPMTKEHFIEWIAIRTKAGNQRKCLKPGDRPEACFCICEEDTIEEVCAYCNLHGLWKA